MSETTLMRFKKEEKEEKSCDVIQLGIFVPFLNKKDSSWLF